MRSTVSELLEHQPDATFRIEDLVGYHNLQYGMDTEVIEGVLDFAFKEDYHWRNWDLAKPFYEVIPRVLSDKTTPALIQHIVAGRPDSVPETVIENSSVDGLLEVNEGTNEQGGKRLLLSPANGQTLKYMGRISHNFGIVTIGQVREELKVHTDALAVSSDDSAHTLLVVSQEGHRRGGPLVRELKVL